MKGAYIVCQSLASHRLDGSYILYPLLPSWHILSNRPLRTEYEVREKRQRGETEKKGTALCVFTGQTFSNNGLIRTATATLDVSVITACKVSPYECISCTDALVRLTAFRTAEVATTVAKPYFDYGDVPKMR